MKHQATQHRGDNFRKELNFFQTALCGCGAGGLEAIATMPFEAMKTWSQLQTKGQDCSLGMQVTVKSIYASKGWRGFYYGLPSCLLQTVGKVGIRFSFFGAYKRFLRQYEIFVNESGAGLNSCGRLLSGFGAGVTEALLWITPCERLKTLRITQIDVPRTSSTHISLFGSFRLIIQTAGFQSLWRGFTATALRNGSAVAVRFWLYASFLESLSGNDIVWYHTAIAGCGVGITTTLLTQPLDVIKSRIQGGPLLNPSIKKSLSSSFSEAIQQEGLGVLARGLAPRIFKIGIGQGVIFFSYDQISRLV